MSDRDARAIENILQSLKDSALTVSKILQNREVDYSNSANGSGDNQLKIDIRVDNIFCDAARDMDIVGFVSEEQNTICFNREVDFDFEKLSLKHDFPSNLFLAFDPLDGSSLIDSNLTIGTIFGIYKNALQGANLVASGYFLYGPRLEFVCSRDKKSFHYIYENGEWGFIQEFKLNHKGSLNAPGATQRDWTQSHFDFVQSFFKEGYRLRYSGGMVADLHQILCKGGGIFSYPATIKRDVSICGMGFSRDLVDSKKLILNNGKLRKLFEVFPFAQIFENAGGYALDGKNRVLDSVVENIHECIPCFFGSKYEIDRLKNA